MVSRVLLELSNDDVAAIIRAATRAIGEERLGCSTVKVGTKSI